ncbi:MAG: monofunctional biosynthetic peptidoglycan transglycosylase [Tannerella sp.]|jgi:monofunctional biosynthetic peptidoglycan transglycosylase|nr:monofunctional biosynthetic peptidoglycan transglycosylase [Tannerella sp.]
MNYSRIKKGLWGIVRWIKNLLVAFFILSLFFVFLYKYVPVYYTPLMLTRSIEQKIRIKHQWVPLSNISPHLVQAVVASEDNLFLEHNGFDFDQIEIAQQEAAKGKRLRGASTISQQTAKNVFLFPHRSWIRKGLEAYFTVLIEWVWGKKRIMEVYLNSIEMGDGIFGVQAVAEAHFHTTADRLTAPQSALIAASLPNPRRFHSDKPSAYLLKRQAAIISLMWKIEPVKFDKPPQKGKGKRK